MSDKRNRYRAVSKMGNNGKYWNLQVKVWWWPFWRTVDDFNSTLERAHERALNHATKRKHVREVYDFGPLP